MTQSHLSDDLRGRITAIVAQHYRSPFLLAETAAQAPLTGDSERLARNRAGYDDDPRTQTALRFAHAMIVTHGRLQQRDYDRMRREKFSEAELTDVISATAHAVAASLLANAMGTTSPQPPIALEVPE